jgi:glycosyl transferase, family 25
MHCYVINLEKDAERRASITQQLNGLGIEFSLFKAVDGRKLSEAVLARQYAKARAIADYREMTAGEIGCALSHIGVYKEMLRTDCKHALILEDDAQLGPELARTLNELVQKFRAEDPVVVLLTHVDKYSRWDAIALSNDQKLVKRYGHWWLAHGYFITQAAAAKLAASLMPVWTAADSWAAFERAGFIKLRALVPYGIGLSRHAQISNLELERDVSKRDDAAHKSVLSQLKHSVFDRFIYQLTLRPFKRVAKQKRTW